MTTKKAYISINHEKLAQTTPTSAQRKIKPDFRIISSDFKPFNYRETSTDQKEIHLIEAIKKG